MEQIVSTMFYNLSTATQKKKKKKKLCQKEDFASNRTFQDNGCNACKHFVEKTKFHFCTVWHFSMEFHNVCGCCKVLFQVLLWTWPQPFLSPVASSTWAGAPSSGWAPQLRIPVPLDRPALLEASLQHFSAVCWGKVERWTLNMTLQRAFILSSRDTALLNSLLYVPLFI